MNMLTRREVATGLGGIVVAFTLLPRLDVMTALAQQPAPLPGSLAQNRMLDAWIRIHADGTATVCTGKVELGQGVTTALAQIAAEELELPLSRLNLISGDTEKTPNEGVTSGSQSIEYGGVALRLAGAQVREILLDLAAKRLGVDAAKLAVADGVIGAPDGRKVSYGELARDADLHREVDPKARPKPPSAHKIVGKPIERFDIPGKVTGGAAYVQDLRLPGMAHGRVVRPPQYGAKLNTIDEAAVKAMPGVIAVVRDGSFLGVIAEREEQAIKASVALARSASWTPGPPLPDEAGIYDHLLSLPAEAKVISEKQGSLPDGAKVLEATYRKPYMAHASIGPSCAVAQFTDGKMTVWTHSQGVFPLRGNLAMGLKLPPDKIHCIHAEGSGCYGHNAADDVGLDAALLARGGAGRPAGPGAVDARRRVRLGAVRPRDGHEDQGGAVAGGQDRRLELRGLQQHPFDAAERAGRQQSAGELVSRRAAARRRRRAGCRCRPAAATATPCRSTTSRASAWSVISSRRCRSGSRRCARSAPMPTCSRPNPSWTSSRSPPAPIRWRSASPI